MSPNKAKPELFQYPLNIRFPMKRIQSKTYGEGFLIANVSQMDVSGTPAAFINNQKSETRFITGALALAKVHPRVDELAK